MRPTQRIKIVDDGGGNRTLEKTPFTQALFNFGSKEQIKLTPNTDGLLFVPLQARGKFPLIWTPNKEYTGDTVRIAAETDDLHALIAYVQKLGMNRGKWRDLFEPQEIEVTDVTLPRSAEWIAYGKEVYERRCIGCHGEKGDGNGPAATFLYNQRPRNFSAGEFKFRLSQKPVPTDGDLLRTITRGVRGTAMPAWYELPLNDRLAVIQYIKYVLAVDRSDPKKPYAYFTEEPPGQPLYIGQPPAPSQDIVAHGKEVWQNAKCWECHGQTGKGDGEKAAGLKDDFGFPIRPADLTSGQFKSGPAVQDIFRTMSTGLSGTPMPSYQGLAIGAGSLGAGLLRPLALRLQGSVDRRTATDLRRGPRRRSTIPSCRRALRRTPTFREAGPKRSASASDSASAEPHRRAGPHQWRCCPAEERVNHDRCRFRSHRPLRGRVDYEHRRGMHLHLGRPLRRLQWRR